MHFVEVGGPEFFSKAQTIFNENFSYKPSMSWLEFFNLSGIVISVTESLNHLSLSERVNANNNTIRKRIS